jgi:exopolysaccharide production protein ExoZ
LKWSNVTLEGAMNRRIPTFRLLDILRGLSALWIVLYHTCLPYVTGHPGSETQWFIAIMLQGQLGVVIFFVISGYCILAAAYGGLIRNIGTSRYFYDRFRRIYPPYLGTCVAAALLQTITDLAQKHGRLHINHVHPPANTIGFWLANLLLVQRETHQQLLVKVFWTLCYETAFYIIIGLILLISQRRSRPQRLSVNPLYIFSGVSAATLGSLIWLSVSPSSCPFPLDLWYQFGIGGIIFFLINLRRFETQGTFFPLLVRSSSFLVFLLTLFYAGRFNLNDSLGHPGTRAQALLTLGLALVFALVAPFDKYLERVELLKPLFILGTFSYSLYLVHTLVLPFVDVLGRIAGLNGRLYPLNMFLQCTFALIAGWAYFFLIERRFLSKRHKQKIVEELSVR